MKPTRARTLLLIIVLTAAVTWALLTVVYSKLPPLTWTGVPALLLAAAAGAWCVRAHQVPGNADAVRVAAAWRAAATRS